MEKVNGDTITDVFIMLTADMFFFCILAADHSGLSKS